MSRAIRPRTPVETAHYAGPVSTLSELVLAQGRSSQADVDWLHMLVGDLQLLADLAFADIVLWVPSGDDDFVAVAHARPSSAATLFYRDFVGQQIKSQWRDLVTRAFDTAHIADSSAALVVFLKRAPDCPFTRPSHSAHVTFRMGTPSTTLRYE